MKRFAEQLKKRAETVRMSTAERDDVRQRLLAYMDYHPLPETKRWEAVRFVGGMKGLPNFVNAMFVSRFVGITAVMLLVVVPAMAENALPGDALYPIKVRFNEELRGAMVSSPYQKIEWETERLERRLAEAQLLADNGRLTAAAEVEVANAIKQHTEAARLSINTIRENDNDEATLAEITLVSSLEVSAEVWTKRDAGAAPSTVSGAVNDAKASIAPSENNEAVSYVKLLSRVESETTRAYEYLDSLDAVASEAEMNDINRRLTDLNIKIDLAAEMKETDEAGAAVLLTEALSNSRKLISFMTNIDVRRNVSIEDLVPLVPTEEEKLRQQLSDATALVEKIEDSLTQIDISSNDYVALRETIDQYYELEETVDEALDDDDIGTAEVAATAALELAQALQNTMVGLGVDLQLNTKPIGQ
jgi:hypothetical protein